MPVSSKKKFLIIGQGIAGSMAAWYLHQRNEDFLLVDNNHGGSSSIISAGIINPITGKRLILTPGFSDYIKEAQLIYKQCEVEFAQEFLVLKPLLRVLKDQLEYERYIDISQDPTYQYYIQQYYAKNNFDHHLIDPLGSFMLQGGAFVRTQPLLMALRRFFEDQGRIVNELFDVDDLSVSKDFVKWRGDIFDHVVFCQGYQGMQNPWFSHLRFKPVKGDILRIKWLGAEDLTEVIYNHVKWCVPLGNNQWLAGATYVWDDLTLVKDEKASQEILNGLGVFIKGQWELLEHHVGIRPAMIDQQPVAIRHEQYPSLAFINGLGSKGFLMAPLMVKQLITQILKERGL